MALLKPAPGQVIHYSYLWSNEYKRGREEGSKDRPCVIVLAVDKDVDGLDIVTVLPITHSPPSIPSAAIEIPHRTKVRLGLDDERSWVVLTEANRFCWPGPDVRPVPRVTPRSMVYGLLPESLFNLHTIEIRRGFACKRPVACLAHRIANRASCFSTDREACERSAKAYLLSSITA